VFEEFRKIVAQRHEYAQDWKEKTGGKVFGYLCSYVPEEVMYAAGILPVRILGTGEPTLEADKYILPMWCSFSRDCLSQGLRGRYDYLDGIVYARCCQHMRQVHFSWVKNIPIGYGHEIGMPGVSLNYSSAAKNFFLQVSRFKSSLEQWLGGGTRISSLALDEAIEVYNTNRYLLRQMYELRKAPEPPLSGTEAAEVVLAGMVMDKKDHNEMLSQVLEKLPERKDRPPEGARIMLLGSPVYDIRIWEFIESLGSIIVTDETCVGRRYFDGEIIREPDRVSAITSRLINRLPCPHHDLGYPGSPHRRRPSYTVQLAKEYNVDGAVFILRKFCDVHGFDFPGIRDALQDSGVPVLQLDLDIGMPLGQLRTRLEAFLETTTALV
jgi:benzoyl-CoA reductase subunit C